MIPPGQVVFCLKSMTRKRSPRIRTDGTHSYWDGFLGQIPIHIHLVCFPTGFERTIVKRRVIKKQGTSITTTYRPLEKSFAELVHREFQYRRKQFEAMTAE